MHLAIEIYLSLILLNILWVNILGAALNLLLQLIQLLAVKASFLFCANYKPWNQSKEAYDFTAVFLDILLLDIKLSILKILRK